VAEGGREAVLREERGSEEAKQRGREEEEEEEEEDEVTVSHSLTLSPRQYRLPCFAASLIRCLASSSRKPRISPRLSGLSLKLKLLETP
jgi:hypothetical protein